MSIKSTIKRLEACIAKREGIKTAIFEVPYITDKEEAERLHDRILKEEGVDEETQVVFIVNFSHVA